MSEIPHLERAGCRALMSQRFVSTWTECVIVYQVFTFQKAYLSVSSANGRSNAHANMPPRQASALMPKEKESLSLKTNKTIEGRIWIWCLAVERKWTAIQCHHGPSWPVLTQSKTILPCLHRIVCQANPSAPVFEPYIESTKRIWVDNYCKYALAIEIFNYGHRSLILIIFLLCFFVLKGQFTQKYNTVIIYQRSVHTNTNVRHTILSNFHHAIWIRWWPRNSQIVSHFVCHMHQMFSQRSVDVDPSSAN